MSVDCGEVRELVESSSLENCRTLTGTVGSNPTLTAIISPLDPNVLRSGCFQRHLTFANEIESPLMTARPEEIRVLVVDDHPVVCRGLAAIIQAEPGMVVSGQAPDGRQAVELFRRDRDRRSSRNDGAHHLAVHIG